MARTPQEVTEAELAVLQVLWEQGAGGCTIRQITDRLYPEGTVSCYATVQKLLERLEAKGCVARDRSGPVHAFAAAVCREELIGRRLRTVAEQLCGGSMAPLLTHLVRAEGMSAEERAELRGLIDQLDNESPRRKSNKK
ncbi:MAG TPA: BlaI/MecI/CopY family transcriptional regulator [Tepidisphaeraceae bacterium]|nr:BlaI/MecI/CopY family transcriptional regulator [Tepidisphaeraceae bacterium]